MLACNLHSNIDLEQNLTPSAALQILTFMLATPVPAAPFYNKWESEDEEDVQMLADEEEPAVPHVKKAPSSAKNA
jgi:hypothetical protein